MSNRKTLYSFLRSGPDLSSLTTCGFLIHGLPLNVTSNSGGILNPVNDLLAYFRTPFQAADPEIDFLLMESPLSNFAALEIIRREGKLLFDSEGDDELGLSRDGGFELKYFSWRDMFIADFGSKGILVLDIFKGLGLGLFPDPSAIHPAIFSNFIFISGLSEVIRPRNLMLIHAAALAKDGKAILIPGFTGGGKTTLSVALLRGGFKILSDDRPFLRKATDGFNLLAFPEDVDVTEQTISFFPELANGPCDLFKMGLRKKKFWVEKVYPNSIIDAAKPKVLLLPNIVDHPVSRLKPMPKIEAVSKLLPHGLLVFDREIAEHHFHLLCQLVEEMDCYQIDFGKDLLEVYKLIEKIL